MRFYFYSQAVESGVTR
ncbi:hypothetical protein H6S30_22700 [Escherichia coli]|nr:hypothetical protein H6S30_22700 [Escherichia coli]